MLESALVKVKWNQRNKFCWVIIKIKLKTHIDLTKFSFITNIYQVYIVKCHCGCSNVSGHEIGSTIRVSDLLAFLSSADVDPGYVKPGKWLSLKIRSG